MKRKRRKIDWGLAVDRALKWILLLTVSVGVMWSVCYLASGAEQPKDACPALESPRHAALEKLAQAHAEYMARVQVQGHQNWDRRGPAAMLATGCHEAAEICAESWPRQSEATEAELWAEFARCWRTSAGHWSVACRKHKYIGAGMAKGRNNIWYGCLIAGD